MILLAENGNYQLFKTKSYVSCNYIVFMKANGFKQEVARSMMLTKKISRYFTSEQLDKAKKMLATIKSSGLMFTA